VRSATGAPAIEAISLLLLRAPSEQTVEDAGERGSQCHAGRC
jgi:hypothetical protein